MWTDSHVTGVFFVLVGLIAVGCLYLYEFDSGKVDYSGQAPSPFHLTDTGKGFMVAAMVSVGLGILMTAHAWVPKKQQKAKEPPKKPES